MSSTDAELNPALAGIITSVSPDAAQPSRRPAPRKPGASSKGKATSSEQPLPPPPKEERSSDVEQREKAGLDENDGAPEDAQLADGAGAGANAQTANSSESQNHSTMGLSSADKEKGSLNTTLSGPSLKDKVAELPIPKSGRSSPKKASNGSRSSKTMTPMKKESGGIAAFLRAIFLCGAPEKAHDIELSNPPTKASPQKVSPSKPKSASQTPAEESKGTTEPPPAIETTETAPEAPAEPSSAKSAPPPPIDTSIPIPAIDVDDIPLAHTPGTPPTPTSDPSVIVPPTPKSVYLPKSETEGVTSGAVQPPGSTGDEPILQRNAGEEDSDGTSFTDEDDVGDVTQDQIQEEDEEERLIMNGGAGIPIGPVRVNVLLLSVRSY